MEDFKFLSQIDSKNHSYLVYSPKLNSSFILKTFPYKKGHKDLQYQKEARTSFLEHPNIYFRYFLDEANQLPLKDANAKSSVILQESFEKGSLLNYRNQLSPDETLVRTIFNHIFKALEYLHSNEVAHLDLKPESIMVSNDARIKLANFGNCWKKGDKIKWRGSKYFRAPELVIKHPVEDIFACDVFSLGIVLFTMIADGILPQYENEIHHGCFFYELMENDKESFWRFFCKIHRQDSVKFSDDFKELFHGMTRSNPKERMTLEDVKKSKWATGPMYSDLEFKGILESRRTF